MGTTSINEYFSVQREGLQWTYFCGLCPIATHDGADRQMFLLTVSQMIRVGACRQSEVMATFGVSKQTLIRSGKRLRAGGIKATVRRGNARRKGARLTPVVLEITQQMLNEGVAPHEVARHVSVPYDTFRKALRDGRLSEPRPMDKAENKSTRSAQDAAAAEGMGTACRRVTDRVMAALGKLSGGAKTKFETGRDIYRGGILCALPALLANGLLDKTDILSGKVRGYYTVIQVLLLTGFLALGRIRNAERTRREPPGECGRWLGLDRSPESRCLRKKYDEMSDDGAADEWASTLTQKWMTDAPEAVGTLYVDGHVRVYHGSLTKLPRRHVTRERLCLRGTTDYWVNDGQGRPFFVVERVVDSGLLEVLRTDIVPRLLKEIPGQPTDAALLANLHQCRFTLVFDREGYSPAFFKEMWKTHRIACISYHKHAGPDWPVEWFEGQSVTLANGETVTQMLAEMGSWIGTGEDALWMREIRKLTESGHQTSLISTAFEIPHTVMASRLFARWCQENFFRYMMEHFDLDMLAEYGTEPLADTIRVINPAFRQLNNQKQSVRAKLAHRRAKFAELTLQPELESDEKACRIWEREKAEQLNEVRLLEQQLMELCKNIKSTEKHIDYKNLPADHKFERLRTGRKRLLDTIRMIAYRAETAMVPVLMEPTIDSAQARSILQTLFTTDADILPDVDHSRLVVQVHRSSTPSTDKHLLALFEQLNATETIYPGTELQLVYEFVGIPP